jgi:hypothetical protein
MVESGHPLAFTFFQLCVGVLRARMSRSVSACVCLCVRARAAREPECVLARRAAVRVHTPTGTVTGT